MLFFKSNIFKIECSFEMQNICHKGKYLKGLNTTVQSILERFSLSILLYEINKQIHALNA